MYPRFICPHCHSPQDSMHLDTAECIAASYLICSECDELIMLSIRLDEKDAGLPEKPEDTPSTRPVAEDRVL